MLDYDNFSERFSEDESIGDTKERDFYYVNLSRGIDALSSKPVVVKTFQFKDDLISTKRDLLYNIETAKKEILLEITMLKSLKDNPFAVSLVEYSMDFNSDFKFAALAMENAEGITIKEYIEKYGPISKKSFYTFTKYFIDAINSFHINGMVHRDLSYNNIFIKEEEGLIEGIKLIDFGEVYKKGKGIKKTLAMTLGFGPPEGNNKILTIIDKTYDIYSCGVILHYLLTGELPYKIPVLSKKDDEKTYKGIERTDIEEELKIFIRRALSFDSKDRPKSMTEIKTAVYKNLR